MTAQNDPDRPEPAANLAETSVDAEARSGEPTVPASTKAGTKSGGVGKRPGAGKAKPNPPRHARQAAVRILPPARKASFARRHRFILVSFLIAVILPVALAGWYLWTRAADQYASYAGFTVRSELGSTSADILGGLGALTGNATATTNDLEILYRFIQSRDLVEKIDDQLDLRAIWSRPENDPFFAFDGDPSLEALVTEWGRKVSVYDEDGILELRVLAFEAQDAQRIAQAILSESTQMINALNDVARDDILRYSRSDLEQAVIRLKEARQAVTAFRNQHQMVDPTVDVQAQAGILTELQGQLAQALIDQGMLRANNAQRNDPRIDQAERRIAVIRQQIENEKQKFGSEVAEGEVLSDLVGKYEGLAVDREFAEQSYTAALAAHDLARAEAQRQSRYLAAFIQPTLAQQAEFPQRAKLLLVTAVFAFLLWMIGVLVYYSLRDRR